MNTTTARLLTVGAVLTAVLGALTTAVPSWADTPGMTVDKAAQTITLDGEIAPRKLDKVTHPDLKAADPRRTTVYPIEVFASHAFPAQKSHETVILLTVKPSDLHKALEGLGLKAGKPVLGKGKDVIPSGPALKLTLSWTAGGKTVTLSANDAIVRADGGAAVPAFKWLFTGSKMTTPDPEKDETVYGADFSKTVIGLFTITDETVIQSTLNEETLGYKLDVNKAKLPTEGTKIKLVIQPE